MKNTYSLIEFQQKYNTQEACEDTLINLKWKNGFVCPICGHTHYYKIGGRKLHLYQCKDCGHQTTVIKDTILENTKLSLIQWFIAFYFVAQNKNGISEISLSKTIGISLKSAWLMLHKIRKAMAERDERYILGGNIEMDEAFFGGKKEGKRGRGSKKTIVAVALQVDEGKYPAYIKMEVVDNCKGETLLTFANKNIKEGSTINSDAFRSYCKLEGCYDSRRKTYNPGEDFEYLKWVHVMISNIKSIIEGTYHGLYKTYLQRYLDEFCYRFNRRHSQKPILDHLMECCVLSTYRKASEVCI